MEEDDYSSSSDSDLDPNISDDEEDKIIETITKRRVKQVITMLLF